MNRTALTATIAAAIIAALVSAPVLAASAYLTAKVNYTLVTADTRWGGCMALLSVSPSSVLPNCGYGWVSFSCTGDFTDPVRAYRMLDQAQLALARDSNVIVEITDEMMVNGYCFARRIDVAK